MTGFHPAADMLVTPADLAFRGCALASGDWSAGSVEHVRRPSRAMHARARRDCLMLSDERAMLAQAMQQAAAICGLPANEGQRFLRAFGGPHAASEGGGVAYRRGQVQRRAEAVAKYAPLALTGGRGSLSGRAFICIDRFRRGGPARVRA
jgi:hypothetical protein